MMKIIKQKNQNKKFVVLSLNKALCTLTFTTNLLISKSAYNKAPNKTLSSIPNIYTPIYLKKLGQVGQFYKSLKKKKSLCGNLANILSICKKMSVIYNTLSPPAANVGHSAYVGHSLLKVVSPSINLSAFGQTLFQRACFIGELFEKEKEFEVNGLELQGTGEQKKMISQIKKKTATVLSLISKCKCLKIVKDITGVVLLTFLKLLFAFLLALLYFLFLPIFVATLLLIFKLDNRFKFLLVVKTPNARIHKNENETVIYNTPRGNSHE